MRGSSTADVVRGLRERVREMEVTHRPASAVVARTGTSFDDLFPDGGPAWGTLIEWLTVAGGGGMTLALAVAARVMQSGGTLVVLDPDRTFYPPAAAFFDLPLQRMIVVRPEAPADALWALEVALRSQAASVVIAPIGRLGDRAYRRLQLAVEAGGGLGFLLRPAELQRELSWAAARLLVAPIPGSNLDVWRFSVEAFRARAGTGKRVELELDDEAGLVSVVSSLGRAASPAIPARPGEVSPGLVRPGPEWSARCA